ncbi:Cornichon family protein [Schizosaccharomyces pombe]
MVSAWIYFTSLMLTCANIMLQMYFTVMYSDLKDDFINPIDLSRKLNWCLDHLPSQCTHVGLERQNDYVQHSYARLYNHLQRRIL